MKTGKIDDMVKGWFVGNFEPTLYRTNECEVAVKHYHIGDREKAHYHRLATEITIVTKGSIRMNDNVYGVGDIIVMEPGEATDFEALSDAENVVVKIPGANNDKYLVES